MYTHALGDQKWSQALSLYTENVILAVCSDLYWVIVLICRSAVGFYLFHFVFS